MSATWTTRAWKLAAGMGLMAIAGCGPVAAPRVAKPAAPPPPPPVAAKPQEPPPPPEVPADLIAKVNELRQLAEEIRSQPTPSLDLDDLDKLEQQVGVLAQRQERLSKLAHEILLDQAKLTPEQRTEFERKYVGEALRPLLGESQPGVQQPPTNAPEASPPQTPTPVD